MNTSSDRLLSEEMEVSQCHEICDRILTMCPQVSLEEIGLLRWRATGSYEAPKDPRQIEMVVVGE